MNSFYESDIKKVLVHEGGYVNHPRDPGGATNYGVTQNVYSAYRKNKGQPSRSVQYIDMVEVLEIYEKQYAKPIQYDRMPPGVAYTVLDGAVNSGNVQSVKWLQRALNANLKVDGQVGEATINAIDAYPNGDYDRLIADICERRMAFLRALKIWKDFGKGWTARVNGVKKSAQLMAVGSVGPLPVYVKGGEKKAFLLDAKTPYTKGMADAGTGAGIISVAIDRATDALGNVSFIPYVGETIGVLTAAGGLLVAGGLVYRSWASSRNSQLADALDLGTEVHS